MKPMLAGKVDEAKLDFPYIVSPKLDGIRCIIKDGVALSRSLKKIPNLYIQELLGKDEYNGFDGELIVGSPTDPNAMQNTTKGVMSIKGTPDFVFWVFDKWDESILNYIDRCDNILFAAANLCFVDWDEANDGVELEKYERVYLERGFEGIMLRKPEAPYKFGRATMKQGNLLKRFTDSEARVVGFVEEMENLNPKTTDNLGHTQRSSHQDGKLGKNTLGALIVEDCTTGIKFQIGSGFSAEQRQEIWNYRDDYLKRVVTYKHFPIGVKDAPRFPTFKCFRDRKDM